MIKLLIKIVTLISLTVSVAVLGSQQNSHAAASKVSINQAALKEYYQKLALVEQQRVEDSLHKEVLEINLLILKPTDDVQKEDMLQQLKSLEAHKQERMALKKTHIDSLRHTAKGYPVTGVLRDTLFLVYARIGASVPQERAANISGKIRMLYENDFLKVDSIKDVQSENTYDVVYEEFIIMSVSENDTIWCGKSMDELARYIAVSIKNSIIEAKSEHNVTKLIGRIGLYIKKQVKLKYT